MLSNWLTRPPRQIVFMEPFFLRPKNSRLLRIQLRSLGMPATDAEWSAADASPLDRFARLMGPRLQGRHWAAKEVLCAEHVAMTKVFAPPRVLVTVRNIVDVALSFFEKHRLQDNLHRFGDDWVAQYCERECAGILDYLALLDRQAIPFKVARYEGFTVSADERASICDFLGWEGGGDVGANLDSFGRSFEVERHGSSVGSAPQARDKRLLEQKSVTSALQIAERCEAFQREFGYA